MYEAMRSLARQVEKLTQEMMTLKLFVAAIPGAAGNAQAVRKALTRSKKPRQRQRAARHAKRCGPLGSKSNSPREPLPVRKAS